MTTDNNGIEHGLKRSYKWPNVMKAFLKKNPACAVCGKADAVNVHHIAPFEFIVNFGRPELELDERNLITLCEAESGKPEENHHLWVGHGGDFKKVNISVREDAQKYNGQTLQQLKEDKEFMEDITDNSLPPIDKLTPEQNSKFLDWLNKTYPKN